MSSKGVSCTIGKDQERYYFYRGRRISAEKARTLRAAKRVAVKRCKRSRASIEAAAAAKARPKAKAASRRPSKAQAIVAKAKAKIAAKRRGRPAKAPPASAFSPAAKASAKRRPSTASLPPPPPSRPGSVSPAAKASAKRAPKAGSVRIPNLIAPLDLVGLPPRFPPLAGSPPPRPSSRTSPGGSPPPKARRSLGPPPPGYPAPPSPPRSSGSAAKERIAERAAQRASVWQLVPYPIEALGVIILLPNHEVDSITRRDLASRDARRALYRKHNVPKGSLIWVDARTNAALHEIEDNRVGWGTNEWRTFIDVIYPNLDKRLHVIEM